MTTSLRDSAPRVLVTDAERSSALAIIRSMAGQGALMVAASADRSAPAFRSRATSARVRYPSPVLDPGGAAAAVLDAVERYRIDLIVPVTDEMGLPLAEARDRCRARIALPDPAALATVTDKRATLDLARSLGVPIPPTIAVADAAEASVRAGEIGWPLVVKPRTSRVPLGGRIEAFSVTYAADPAGLARRMASLDGRVEVLLQAPVAGEGHGVELLASEGRVLAAFQHHRLHEVPITGGASSFRESVPLDPVLLEHSARLIGELRWTGLAMVEFRVGPDGPFLMEVNGRIWGSLPLAVHAGMDFPARLLDLELGRGGPAPSAPATDYRVGLRGRNLELEIVWIGSVLRGERRHPFRPTPPRRAALGALGGLLDPRVADDVLSLRDPGPGLALAGRVAGKVGRKIRGGAEQRHG